MLTAMTRAKTVRYPRTSRENRLNRIGVVPAQSEIIIQYCDRWSSAREAPRGRRPHKEISGQTGPAAFQHFDRSIGRDPNSYPLDQNHPGTSRNHPAAGLGIG